MLFVSPAVCLCTIIYNYNYECKNIPTNAVIFSSSFEIILLATFYSRFLIYFHENNSHSFITNCMLNRNNTMVVIA